MLNKMFLLDNLAEKAANAGEADYRRGIRAAVRGLWGGHLSLQDYAQSMVGSVRLGLTRAFYEGAAAVGMYPEDLTLGEKARLAEALNQETSWVYNFGRDIEDVRRKKGKLTPLLDRTEMWVLRYGSFKSWAMQLVGGDKKLRWKMNPIKEHCHSCIKLDGKVYRASVWQRYDIRPRSRRLECEGWRCGCEFVPTNDPVTPGRPPAIP